MKEQPISKRKYETKVTKRGKEAKEEEKIK